MSAPNDNYQTLLDDAVDMRRKYAALEAHNRQLREALEMMLAQGGPLGSYGDAAFAAARAALAATEPR